VLLAKTLRSSTLRLALIWIGIFGTAVAALLGYVYWSSASYMLRQSDQALAMELVTLREAYTRAGREQLIAAITQRMSGGLVESGVYLLADPSGAPLAGNLAAWPASLKGSDGWGNFKTPEWQPNAARQPLLRATFETLADGTRLLVGKDITELDQVADRINTALLLTALLILVVAAAASASITRRTVGRIESINATSRAIMQSGSASAYPCAGPRMNGTSLPPTSIPCSSASRR
jgi:type II secretory pathway pseudopilin PulG